jgi:hypothetical protein
MQQSVNGNKVPFEEEKEKSPASTNGKMFLFRQNTAN